MNSYEQHAREFLRIRDDSTVGLEIIERWANSLDSGADVLELACGGGVPVTRAIQDRGLNVWAVDASPTLVTQFQARFPNIPVQCAMVQESDFFNRTFGAVLAIGLIFLLDMDDQLAFIQRVSQLLVPGGRFLFTAPLEAGKWPDSITEQPCISLGRQRYERALQESGFRLLGEHQDEGRNNYYDALYIPANRA